MKSTYTKQYETFLNAIKLARVSQKLTQKAVAERLKVPQSFISKYENGERRLDVAEFFTIAKALRVDPWHLLRNAGFD